MKRVLIIEDDRFNRRLYRDLLESLTVTIELAASATSGLEIAQAQPPDLVVMDIELPGMNGLEATQVLKADARTCAVPILIISAHAMIKQQTAARAAGADGFLSKPLNIENFQEVVRTLLHG